MTIANLQRDVAALRNELQETARNRNVSLLGARIQELVSELEAFEKLYGCSEKTSFMHVDLLYSQDLYNHLMGIAPGKKRQREEADQQQQILTSTVEEPQALSLSSAEQTSVKKIICSRPMNPAPFFFSSGIDVFYRGEKWKLVTYEGKKTSCKIQNSITQRELVVSPRDLIYFPTVGEICFFRNSRKKGDFSERAIYYKAKVEETSYYPKEEKWKKCLHVKATLLERPYRTKVFKVYTLSGMLPLSRCSDVEQIFRPITLKSSSTEEVDVYKLKYAIKRNDDFKK